MTRGNREFYAKIKFGISVHFLRKYGFCLSKWIPAFAGMTGGNREFYAKIKFGISVHFFAKFGNFREFFFAKKEVKAKRRRGLFVRGDDFVCEY